jgi:hypothetical protein
MVRYYRPPGGRRVLYAPAPTAPPRQLSTRTQRLPMPAKSPNQTNSPVPASRRSLLPFFRTKPIAETPAPPIRLTKRTSNWISRAIWAIFALRHRPCKTNSAASPSLTQQNELQNGQSTDTFNRVVLPFMDRCLSADHANGTANKNRNAASVWDQFKTMFIVGAKIELDWIVCITRPVPRMACKPRQQRCEIHGRVAGNALSSGT